MDGEYVFTYGDKQWLSGSSILATYPDWRDIAAWPEVPGAASIPLRAAKRQGAPTKKTGAVGAFCRCYDIPAVIEQFLGGIYEPTAGTPSWAAQPRGAQCSTMTQASLKGSTAKWKLM